MISGDTQLGFLAALLIGFGFGFVLERAGFGRSTKLAAQFYLHDMTVFKVMFTGIIVALLGAVLATSLGVIEFKTLAEGAVSETFIWPALLGGLVLGAGFIISGYCPGTSVVAFSSGNLDGLVTIFGVITGSYLYAEAWPLVSGLHLSGAMGHQFFSIMTGIPLALLAIVLTLGALAAFVGVEKVEVWATAKLGLRPQPIRRRKGAFATIGVITTAAAVTLLLPEHPRAEDQGSTKIISQREFVQRLLDEPWSLRVLDLRDLNACQAKRIPGAECVPIESLANLGLSYAPAGPDLILSGAETLREVPAEALDYKGNLRILEGGFKGWSELALKAPVPPVETDETARREYLWRAALHGAMTGMKAAPPPPAPSKKFVPKKKKKGGGCG